MTPQQVVTGSRHSREDDDDDDDDENNNDEGEDDDDEDEEDDDGGEEDDDAEKPPLLTTTYIGATIRPPPPESELLDMDEPSASFPVGNSKFAKLSAMLAAGSAGAKRRLLEDGGGAAQVPTAETFRATQMKKRKVFSMPFNPPPGAEATAAPSTPKSEAEAEEQPKTTRAEDKDEKKDDADDDGASTATPAPTAEASTSSSSSGAVPAPTGPSLIATSHTTLPSPLVHPATLSTLPLPHKTTLQSPLLTLLEPVDKRLARALHLLPLPFLRVRAALEKIDAWPASGMKDVRDVANGVKGVNVDEHGAAVLWEYVVQRRRLLKGKGREEERKRKRENGEGEAMEVDGGMEGDDDDDDDDKSGDVDEAELAAHAEAYDQWVFLQGFAQSSRREKAAIKGCIEPLVSATPVSFLSDERTADNYSQDSETYASLYALATTLPPHRIYSTKEALAQARATTARRYTDPTTGQVVRQTAAERAAERDAQLARLAKMSREEFEAQQRLLALEVSAAAQQAALTTAATDMAAGGSAAEAEEKRRKAGALLFDEPTMEQCQVPEGETASSVVDVFVNENGGEGKHAFLSVLLAY